MLVTVATVATVISVLTSVQSVLVLGVFSATLSGADPLPARELAVRVAINLGATSLAIGAVALAHPERRGGWGRAASIVGISLVCALARASAQAAAGVYSAASGPGRVALVTEIATTGLLLALVTVLPFFISWSAREKFMGTPPLLPAPSVCRDWRWRHGSAKP